MTERNSHILRNVARWQEKEAAAAQARGDEAKALRHRREALALEAQADHMEGLLE